MSSKWPPPLFPECEYCRNSKHPNCVGHTKFNCPRLADLKPCRICHASGPMNHTEMYCPLRPNKDLPRNEQVHREIDRYFDANDAYSGRSQNTLQSAVGFESEWPWTRNRYNIGSTSGGSGSVDHFEPFLANNASVASPTGFMTQRCIATKKNFDEHNNSNNNNNNNRGNW